MWLGAEGCMPFARQTFDPETLELLSGVFEQAWEDTQSRAPLPEDTVAMREKLARHIMDMASDGVRDPDVLKFSALRVFFDRQ
jgi:hypothetical protein